LTPLTEYWQPSLANTGESPGKGSVSVPATVPLDVIVPGKSSIAALAEKANVSWTAPFVRFTEPLSWWVTPETGFCQLLVLARVPSLRTSRRELITSALASAGVEQGSVVVRVRVNLQFPVACTAVSEPPPVRNPPSGLVLFSHAPNNTIVARQRTRRFT
jgi:hypothetical protein